MRACLGLAFFYLITENYDNDDKHQNHNDFGQELSLLPYLQLCKPFHSLSSSLKHK